LSIRIFDSWFYLVWVYADAGLDWQRVAVGLCAESEGFHKFSMAVENEFREALSENDLLLLSKEKVSAVQVISAV
jgi:hypothetical protein